MKAQDQLGELAESFNSMTASIEDLLRQAAEKKRLEEELRIAHEIQMSLLPQGPLVMPGLSVTALCVPAREVGGDYYDFLPLDDHRLGLLIADVSGKGTSAALYMAELKGLVLSLSRIHTSPRELLIMANRIIAEHLDARSFITMTYAVVDLRARTMTYARAGHTPLIYVPGPGAASRQARILAPDGLVLGLKLDNGEMFERLLEEETIPLHTGDLCLFFTDGISEAMNEADDCFGEERLGTLVAEHAHLPSDELRERVLRDIASFVGAAPQHDDMTMILLKVEDMDAAAAADSAADLEAASAGAVRASRARPGRHLPHAVGHRGEHRPRPARDARRAVAPVVGRAAFHVPADGQPSGRGPHLGPPRRRGRSAADHREPPSHGDSLRLVRLRDEFEPLQTAIGYRFRDRGLLEHAMTHTSRANEDVSGGVIDNESLEFLGDAVLGFVIADLLFREFPDFDEGQKSKTKASLVSTATLARQAERLGLGEHLLLGRGEEKTGGRRKQALLADTYEALIAAIYLDGGIEQARAFIVREFAAAGRGGAGRRRLLRGLQVGAAGTPAVARRAAPRIPPGRHARAGSPQAVSGGGRDSRGGDRGRRRHEQEGSGAGSGKAGDREIANVELGMWN